MVSVPYLITPFYFSFFFFFLFSAVSYRLPFYFPSSSFSLVSAPFFAPTPPLDQIFQPRFSLFPPNPKPSQSSVDFLHFPSIARSHVSQLEL